MRNLQVKVPGTCGELWQGVLDGTHLLITCPVNIYSYIKINIDGSSSRIEKRFKAKFTFYITKLVNGGGELVETSARRQLIPN